MPTTISMRRVERQSRSLTIALVAVTLWAVSLATVCLDPAVSAEMNDAATVVSP